MKILSLKKTEGYDDFNSPYWQEILREAERNAKEFEKLSDEGKESILEKRRSAREAKRNFHIKRVRNEADELIRRVAGQ